MRLPPNLERPITHSPTSKIQHQISPTKVGLRKLLQKPHIILNKQTQVGNPIHNHCEAIESHSEGESTYFAGVVGSIATFSSDGFEDGWINDSAASDFDPFRSFAGSVKLEIDFKAWLGERKEVGTKTHFGF